MNYGLQLMYNYSLFFHLYRTVMQLDAFFCLAAIPLFTCSKFGITNVVALNFSHKAKDVNIFQSVYKSNTVI